MTCLRKVNLIVIAEFVKCLMCKVECVGWD